ncbi:MAG: response regulator [Phycisphaerae bacterium]|nr:response regulator [Saprospiraceae bacterium]
MKHLRHIVILILTLLPLSNASLWAQGQRYVFERLKSVRHKFTVNTVTTDEHGRVWFSTMGRGAFCFDGYNYFRYQTNSNDPNSLSNDRVFDLLPDTKKRVWFATLNGLCYLDRHTDKIHRFMSYQDSVRQFNALFEDRSGTIWIGSNRGMFRFDEPSQSLVKVPIVPNKKMSGVVHCFYEDKKGTLWSGKADGIYKFTAEGQQYTQLPVYLPEEKGKSIPANVLFEDSKDVFWIGGAQGLFVFDCVQEKATRALLPDSLAFRPITTMIETPDGALWIGTSGKGLVRWDRLNNSFQHFKNSSQDPYSLPQDVVLSLKADSFGNLWVGSGYEVSRLDLTQNAFTLWPINIQDPGARENSTYRMAEDKLGGILVSSTSALWYYEKLGPKPKPILVDGQKAVVPEFFTSPDSTVWAVINSKLWIWNVPKRKFESFKTPPLPAGILNMLVDRDEPQVIWIATQTGISRLDRRSGELRSFTQFSPPPFDQYVQRFVDDGRGSLWLDLPNFLGKFDKRTFKTTLFNNDTLPPHKLINDEIQDINVAPNGWVWVATTGGITAIDPATGDFHNISGKDNLPDNVVNTVLFDKDQNTWVILPDFISRIDPNLRVTRNINTNAMLQASSWTRGRCQLWDGRLLFATLNGPVLIEPSKLTESTKASAILLTRFEISGETKNHVTGLEFLKRISLSNTDNNITIEWAGIQTARPEELRYECKLERKGQKKDWEQKGAERQAVYANLEPGAYTFRVRIAGSESPELSLEIAIAPAWWQAESFKMLLFALFVTAAYLFWRNREDRQELLKQKELAEQTAGYKSRFLANMSHEIRTPMNAILGLSRLLTESELPPKQSEYADAIRHSSENLLVIVNDVLDQIKIESGQFKFQHKPFDLELIVRHLQNTLGFKAEEKGLLFGIKIAPEVPTRLVGDPVRLNQILTNLLGNAIKFTDKGAVTLDIGFWTLDAGHLMLDSDHPKSNVQSPTSNVQHPISNIQSPTSNVHLTFTVSDTGIGIPPEQMSRVFESFQQADDDISANYGGTGLGLSITKDLVEQQGGKIELESEVGKGTAISAIIPFELDKISEAEAQQGTQEKIAFENLRILLVEDTFFNQMLAIELLKSRIPGVEIEVAENGQVALEKIESDGAFSLILMDVKMPVMDGLEATRRIRALPKFAHLPIVALTANAVQAELDKCRDVGMDAYVTKPIDADELFATMRKVIVYPP